MLLLQTCAIVVMIFCCFCYWQTDPPFCFNASTLYSHARRILFSLSPLSKRWLFFPAVSFAFLHAIYRLQKKRKNNIQKHPFAVLNEVLFIPRRWWLPLAMKNAACLLRFNCNFLFDFCCCCCCYAEFCMYVVAL